VLDALLAHRLPDFAQLLRILVAQVSSPLEVNGEGLVLNGHQVWIVSEGR